MKALLILLLLAGLGHTMQTQDEYVCSPCGNSCDEKVYSGTGTCSSCGMPLVKKSSIQFTNITADQLCQRLKANPKAVLLDVRSPGEFAGTSKEFPSFGHFKKAININVTELEKRMGELSKYKDQEILVYCSHNHRSPASSYILGLHGFKNVKNMTGGVSTLTDFSKADCLEEAFVFHSR